jgi:hypothetical protein
VDVALLLRHPLRSLVRPAGAAFVRLEGLFNSEVFSCTMALASRLSLVPGDAVVGFGVLVWREGCEKRDEKEWNESPAGVSMGSWVMPGGDCR